MAWVRCWLVSSSVHFLSVTAGQEASYVWAQKSPHNGRDINPPNLGVSQANKSKLVSSSLLRAEVTCYNWPFQAANLLLW